MAHFTGFSVESRVSSASLRPVIASVFLAALCCCGRDPVWLRVGDEPVRKSEVEAAFSKKPTETRDPAQAMRELFGPRLFVREAARLGLPASSPTIAQESILAQWRDELRSRLQPADVSEDEIFALYRQNPKYPYYPERVYLSLFVFARAADAKRFAAAVADAKSVDAFKRRFDGMHLDPRLADAGDVFVARSTNTAYPRALVDASFAAKIGVASGPIASECSRFADGCHYVIFARSHHVEQNSFAIVKEKLRHEAYAHALSQQLQARKQALFAKDVHIEQGAIDALSRATQATALR